MSGVLSVIRAHPLAATVSAAGTAAAAASDAWEYELPHWAQQVDKFLQYLRTDEGRRLRQRVIAALLLGAGSAWLYKQLASARKRAARQRAIEAALAEHRPLPEASPKHTSESLADHFIHAPDGANLLPTVKPDKGGAGGDKPATKRKVAVDAVFFARLGKILGIVIPSVYSKEMAYVVILTILLFARTAFSIYIAELIGMNAQSLVSRKWSRMWAGVKLFAVVTIPASAVNAGLKYFTEMVSLRFRKRLSEHVHDQYLAGVNFYKAVNLGGGERIDNADQRVTSDIKDFSDEIASLYASLLKPLLDVVLFTYKLKTILGWQGPAAMHSYFLLSAVIKKKIMPSLGTLVARESELEGFYRTAHNRLITNSEEIAFYDGSKREKVIINRALQLICQHIAYARWVKALVGVFDGLLVKYYASIAGYATLLSPFIFMRESVSNASTADLTREYIRNSQYLGQLSTAVSALVMVGNKLTSIAGYTSRVSELLEQVKHLNQAGNVPFEVKPEAPHIVEEAEDGSTQTAFIKEWKERSDAQHALKYEIRHAKGGGETPTHVVGGGDIEVGEDIEFRGVDIVSPEGKLLVHDLNFTVQQGTNVMVTGPNGVGKSSLFRVIGELWPLHCGTLIKPVKEDILFVPQRPYLVMGTLRDQIIYPHQVEDMQRLGVTDEDLGRLLAIVDPARNITTEWEWDTVKDWMHAFSGGQKQRVGMARLFYHKPKFAILDECTSAVSDEVEGSIYQACRLLGITIFTVSHRPTLAQYHDKVLRFEGEGRWSVSTIDSAAEIARVKREKALLAGYKQSIAASRSTTDLTKAQSKKNLAATVSFEEAKEAPTRADANGATQADNSAPDSNAKANANTDTDTNGVATNGASTSHTDANDAPATSSSHSGGKRKKHGKH